MREKTELEKQFHEMLTKEDFGSLDSYKVDSTWDTLSQDERTLLALLFIAQGEHLLKKSDGKAIENFDLAQKIASNNSLVLYRQAIAYASQSQNLRCLNAACTSLQSVLLLEPNFCDAWAHWGCVLVRIGILHNDLAYFYDAQQKFEKANSLTEQLPIQKKAEFYWQWGLCWYLMGHHSGEAHDFHMAIEKYRLAAEQGMQKAEFWNDFGNAIGELAILIGRGELFLEAVEFYRNAVRADADFFEGWLHLACSCQRVYEASQDHGYFIFSNECFVRAEELNSNDLDLWINWGRLYFISGKFQDPEHFQISCEKFKRANDCEQDNPLVLGRWGAAQTQQGIFTERVDLLREAEIKLIRSLEIFPKDTNTWYDYGQCLNELGRYFEDEKFYEQALEKFRYGLTLDDKHILLWYGLATSYFALGQFQDDAHLFEKTIECCEKVVSLGGDLGPQFYNDWGSSLVRLSEIYQEQNYIESAIEKFEKAIGGKEEAQFTKHPRAAAWLYNYGCAYDFLGTFTEDTQDHEKAIQVLSLVLNMNPGHTHARYNLAVALTHLGDLTDDTEYYHKALEHFQVIISEDVEDEVTWSEWGLTLITLAELMHDPIHPENTVKLHDQAEEKLVHAVALGHTPAFYHLACLYSLQRNFTLSMHYIERAEADGVLPPLDDVLNDEWLEGLRQTPEFRNFISLLTNLGDFVP